MVKNLFDVLTSANLVFAVSTTQNKICSYRKIAAYALGVLFKKSMQGGIITKKWGSGVDMGVH
jgi:hypothetical protein